MDKWRTSEFLDDNDDPLGPMANLVDIILVFTCGLIAALVALSPDLQKKFSVQENTRDLTLGQELTQPPQELQKELQQGKGMEALGQVYRDPKTGKLILIGKD